MEKFIELLKLENEETEYKIKELDPVIDFYKTFTASLSSTNFIKLNKVSKTSIFLASLNSIDSDLSIDELILLTDDFSHFLLHNNDTDIKTLLQCVQLFNKLTFAEISNLSEFILSDKKGEISTLSENEKLVFQNIMRCKNELDINETSLIEFLMLTNINMDMTFGTIVLLSNIRNLNTIITTRACNLGITSKQIQSLKGKEYKKFIDSIDPNLAKIIIESEKFFEDLKSDANSFLCNELNRKKELLISLKNNNKLIASLQKAINSNEITNFKELLQLVKSSSDKDKILKFIYEHNKKYYDELYAEYSNLKENSALSYQVLLSKYGISMDSYDVGSIMRNEIDDVKFILEKLSLLGFKNPSDLLKILKTSDVKNVSYIYDICLNNIVSVDLFKNNLELFDTYGIELSLLKNNINFLQDKKINTHLFSGCETILLSKTSKLKENFDILNEYGLFNTLKSGMNLEFLCSSNLRKSIDSFLELGYEDLLEKNIQLLNYHDKLDRLYILKQMNIPVTDISDVLEVLTTNKFLIEDSEIKKYLCDVSNLYLPNLSMNTEGRKKLNELSRLNQFNFTHRTYNIDGIIISKNKVERSLRYLSSDNSIEDRLFSSIVRDSILDSKQISSIKKNIYTYVKK